MLDRMMDRPIGNLLTVFSVPGAETSVVATATMALSVTFNNSRMCQIRVAP